MASVLACTELIFFYITLKNNGKMLLVYFKVYIYMRMPWTILLKDEDEKKLKRKKKEL